MPLPRRRWYRHPLSVSILTLVLAVGLHRVGWLAFLEGPVVRLLAPIQRSVVGLNVAAIQWWGDRRSRQQLRAENQRLTEQLRQLAAHVQQLRGQLEDLRVLQDQAAFSQRRQRPVIPAHVIGRELSASAQVLVIDRGERSKLRVGLPVIAGDGVLVGIVREVGAEHAKVMLLTDARLVTPAAIAGQAADVAGVISGEFGVSLKLNLIPQSYALQPGELVVTSGLEPEVPRGLLIGTVARVVTPADQFFHEAFVQPMVPYHSIAVTGVMVPR